MEQSSGEEQMTKCSKCCPAGTSVTGDVAAFECKAGSTLEVLTCLGTRQRKGRNIEQEAASDVPPTVALTRTIHY